MITHFSVQSSVTTECVPLFTVTMRIMRIMIKIMDQVNNNNTNLVTPQLIVHIITLTVGKWVNM